MVGNPDGDPGNPNPWVAERDDRADEVLIRGTDGAIAGDTEGRRIEWLQDLVGARQTVEDHLLPLELKPYYATGVPNHVSDPDIFPVELRPGTKLHWPDRADHIQVDSVDVDMDNVTGEPIVSFWVVDTLNPQEFVEFGYSELVAALVDGRLQTQQQLHDETIALLQEGTGDA